MSQQSCPSSDRLASFADQALTPEELELIEEHVSHCGACSQEVDELRLLIADIAAPLPEQPPLDVESHVASVMARLEKPPVRRPTPWTSWWSGLAVASAAAAALFLLLPNWQQAGDPNGDGQWAARGESAERSLARDVGVQVYGGAPLRRLQAGGRLSAGKPLTAGLKNLGEGPAYLLLFSVDGDGEVRWISPQYTDPKSDPESTLIPPSEKERLLPSSVVFDDLKPGQLQIVSMITKNPQRVSAIESLGAAERRREGWSERFPDAEVRQLTLTVTR